MSQRTWLTKHLRDCVAWIAVVGLFLIGFSIGANAEEPGPPRSGEISLTGPYSLHQQPLTGTLHDADASELAELGGALLISGTTGNGNCTLRFSIGKASRSFTLSSEPSVVYLELFDVHTGSNWTLQPNNCRARLEGALLFVGSAAAYVGDNPGAWWASARETLSPGIQ